MAGAAGVAAVLAAVLAALTTLLVSCSSTPAAEPSARASDIQIDAEVVQLRRDQVLQRVSVAVANRGATDVVVDSVRLRADGFRFPGTIRKDSPVADGVVVNLPVPYRVVDCPATGEPQVGRPQVTLRVHTEQDPEPRTVRITADDGDGLLQRIATRACDVERTQQQVDLAFADEWRIEQTENGPEAHGMLRARLVDGPARDITQGFLERLERSPVHARACTTTAEFSWSIAGCFRADGTRVARTSERSISIFARSISCS
jgi:hypothetical protein